MSLANFMVFCRVLIPWKMRKIMTLSRDKHVFKLSWHPKDVGRNSSSELPRDRKAGAAQAASSQLAQVAYFGWYQMHAKVQTGKIKTYYEQNPTTGEEIGQ